VRGATLFAAIQRVLGPVLLGLGTIFQPKANVTDHWSTSPRVEVVDHVAGVDAGAPAPDDTREPPRGALVV